MSDEHQNGPQKNELGNSTQSSGELGNSTQLGNNTQSVTDKDVAKMQSAPPMAAAFLTYIEGGDLAMAAELHAIPLKTLTGRASRERWAQLREVALSKGMLAVARSVDRALGPDAAKLELIHRNREKNFRLAEQMRDDLQDLVQGIRSGSLEIEEVKLHKGAPIRYSRKPSIGDRVALVNYASQVAALGYTALGDAPAARSADASPGKHPGGGAASQPTINIVLPFSIAKPRDEQAAGSAGPVVDV
jgi:hypothetical protein